MMLSLLLLYIFFIYYVYPYSPKGSLSPCPLYFRKSLSSNFLRNSLALAGLPCPPPAMRNRDRLVKHFIYTRNAPQTASELAAAIDVCPATIYNLVKPPLQTFTCSYRGKKRVWALSANAYKILPDIAKLALL